MSTPQFERADFLIPFITAPISFFSSIFLAYTILFRRNKRQWKKPKEQLLLGLSFLDICGSFAFSFSTLPAPYWINSPYPTLGTDATCKAQGFLVQMSLGVPMYNSCICIYYLLAVRYRVRDLAISKRVIPVMHAVVIFFSLGSAVAALSLNVLGYDGILGCWINDERIWRCHCDYGNGENQLLGGITPSEGPDTFWLCHGVQCERTLQGDCSVPENRNFTVDDGCLECEICDEGKVDADTFAVIFAAVPIGMSFVFVVVSMVVLYWTVRKTEERSSRWNFAGSSRLGTLSLRTMETGFLYSGALILTYLPTVLSQLLPRTGNNNLLHDVFQLINVIFLPLQGFSNLLIYTSEQWLPYLENLSCLGYFRRALQCLQRKCDSPNSDDVSVQGQPDSRDGEKISNIDSGESSTSKPESKDSDYDSTKSHNADMEKSNSKGAEKGPKMDPRESSTSKPESIDSRLDSRVSTSTVHA